MADVDISKYRAQVVRDGFRPSNPGFVESEGQDPVNPPGTNNFVPYSGATDNVELGQFGLGAGYVSFDTSLTSPPDEQGIMYWDADNQTVDVILNGTIMQIGQDLFYPVKNQTGSTIPKGTAVRFAGTVGASGRLLIAPFIANNSVPSSRFMGVTSEEILDGADGKVMWFGRIRGINTNAFNEGDILYASTTTAGGFQTTIPVAPNNIVQVAAVVTKSINQGAIFVRPTIGSNINKDEGVKITSVANLDLLQYQSGTALWENKTLAQVIGSAYVPSTRTITINGTTQDLSANRTFNVGTVTGVTASSPLFSSGGATPNITIQQATATQNGFLSSTDWSTFNNKENAITAGTTAQYFRGDKTFQTLNTSVVPELTNLYYTEARVNANTNVAANTAARHNAVTIGTANGLSLSTQVLSLGLASAGVTGALSGTDWSTFNSKQNALTNPVTGTGTTNYLAKFTGSTTVGNSQVFDNGTNVGIGTTVFPYGPKMSVNSTGENTLSIQTTDTVQGTTGTILYIGTSATTGSTSGVIRVLADGGVAATNLILQPSSGNVLIGTTTNAGFRLDVNGTGRFSGVLTTNSGTNSTNGIQIISSLSSSLFTGGIEFIRTTVAGGSKVQPLRDAAIGGVGLSFLVTANNTAEVNATYTSAMNILNNGNVGIGVSPATRLEVTSGSPSSAEVQRWTYNAGNPAYSLRLKQDVSSGLVKHVFDLVNDGTTYSNNLVLTNGNVGIGTSSPGTSPNNSLLGFALGSNIQARTAVPQLALSSNIDGDWFSPTYKVSNFATQIYLDSNQGTIGFRTAPSGTAGAAITWNTPAILITNGGNVLIGTTTDSGFKLDVNGTGRFTSNLTTNGIFIGRTSNGQAFGVGNGVDTDLGIFVQTNNILFTNSGGSSGFSFAIGGSTRFSINATGTNTFTAPSGNVVSLVQTASGSFAQYQLLSGSTNPWIIGTQDNFLSNGLVFRNSSDRMVLTTTGNLLINTTTDVGATLHVNGTIRTGAPSGGSAVNWKLGTSRGGTVTTNATVRVEIDGVLVDLVARYV